MDSSGSVGNGQERNNNNRRFLRLDGRRYRDRIWCLPPEAWLALGFSLLVMGLSLLNTGYCFASDADRELVMKFGAFVLCSGWAALIFLVERVKSRNWCGRFYIHNPRPAFVGVSISPPIQPEFLSAMLLPEIERGWVSAETLPGFEPRHAEIVRPPTQQATAGEENGGKESCSKRRRNRKKKANNSVSELDAASAAQESNEFIGHITTVGANQENAQLRYFNLDDELPSQVRKQENEQDFKQPNQDCEQISLQKDNQPRKLDHDDENLNKVISSEARHSSEEGNQQPSLRLNDTSNKDDSSAVDLVLEENPASDHNTDPRQTFENSLQTAYGLMAEASNIESANITTNLISSQDRSEKSELTSVSLDQTSVNENCEQLNKTPSQLGNMSKLEIGIPKEIRNPADQTMSPNTTSGGMQQVVSKPVSPEFITFTSKKRNRRRKK